MCLTDLHLHSRHFWHTAKIASSLCLAMQHVHSQGVGSQISQSPTSRGQVDTVNFKQRMHFSRVSKCWLVT